MGQKYNKMDTDDITNGLSLLEEVLESTILNVNYQNIKSDDIIKIAQNRIFGKKMGFINFNNDLFF